MTRIMKYVSLRYVVSFILLLVLIASSGCISRLRQDFLFTRAKSTRHVKVVGTQLFRKAAVNVQSESSADVIIPGEGNVLVLTSEHRGGGGPESDDNRELIRMDAVVRFHLYVPLPTVIIADSLLVDDRIFAQQFGEYTRTAEELKYSGQNGYIVIDSLAREFLFARMNGVFKSPDGDSIRFHGSFKARIER